MNIKLFKYIFSYSFGLYMMSQTNYSFKAKILLPIALPVLTKLVMIHEFNKETQELREIVENMFNGDIELLTRNHDDLYTFKIIKGYFEQINKKTLETALNTKIFEMELLPKNRNWFYVKGGEITESKYSKLEKGSLDRLFCVLDYLKMNPQYLSSQENDIEISHSFIVSMNPKRLQRQLVDIEHKLGVKKNSLNFNYDNGKVEFILSKDLTKIYILDNIISKVKKPKRMELPFIIGCDSSGIAQIEDLVELKHLLIAGKTGSGKSCTFKGLIETMMYWNQNIAWYMVDFAESALVRYLTFRNVRYVESDFNDVNKNIDEILENQQKRMKLFREMKVENIQEYNNLPDVSKLPYLILAIDEANGFKEEWNKKEFEPIEQKMKTILKRGRKYGIFTIHAVQQTNDNDYVKSWRTQMTRVGHLLEDLCDANNLTNKKEVAEKIPKLQVGDFYLITSEDCKKLKGCLTNKENDKLYNILKEVYGYEHKTPISATVSHDNKAEIG